MGLYWSGIHNACTGSKPKNLFFSICIHLIVASQVYLSILVRYPVVLVE